MAFQDQTANMAPQQFACKIVQFILLTFVSYELCTAAVQLKLTNLECESPDPSLLKFRECRLKFIRRGVPALNVYADVFRPINAIMINIAIYKKANGYKPFLYNVSFDCCEFMGKASKNMIGRIVYQFIAEYSNLNHTCPFSDAFIVKNLILTEDKFRLIPLPSGEYMLKLIFSSEGQRYAIVKTYLSRIE